MSSSSEDENDSNFAAGISHLPMNPMLDTLRLTSQGPDHDPSLLGMSFPVVKKKKKSPKPNTKGGEVEDETKEEDIDPSKLDIKFVDQTWDDRRHNWRNKSISRSDIIDVKVPKSKKPLIVIRRQFGKTEGSNESIRTFVDIKSAVLLETLRVVLRDVASVSLRAKYPSLRLEILYAFLPDLKAYHERVGDKESDGAKHLNQLIDFLGDWYQSTTEEFTQLTNHGEITYELLWALFKPNDMIFTIDPDSEQPRCYIYDFGDTQEVQGQKYFEITCRSLHYDGKWFGEIQTFLKVPEFRGARHISALEVYPLKYHSQPDEIKTRLIAQGRKTISLMGVVHCEFKGLALYRSKGKAVKINIKGRTIIDAASFKEFNANYSSIDMDPSDPEFFGRRFHAHDRRLQNQSNLKKKALQPEEVTDEEACLCSPTVQGFSLSKRMWAEFTVSGISDIVWNDLPFDALVLAAKKKDMLYALVEQATSQPEEDGINGVKAPRAFDDFVEEKGQGLVVLLHGSPGTGKTLTAEAISEFQRRPLYRVSAGDLDSGGLRLESRLNEIMDLATRWKAIVLLDEADVFVEKREMHSLHHNTMVSIFLRQLEYFQGIMILTTNRVTVFDDAIKSRIHLGIKYDDLNQKARAKIWTTFIDRADSTTEDKLKSKITAKQIQELSQRPTNGRQIKNTVRIAHALASGKELPLGYDHLTTALDANEDFDTEHRNIGLPPNAANSYM